MWWCKVGAHHKDNHSRESCTQGAVGRWLGCGKTKKSDWDLSFTLAAFVYHHLVAGWTKISHNAPVCSIQMIANTAACLSISAANTFLRVFVQRNPKTVQLTRHGAVYVVTRDFAIDGGQLLFQIKLSLSRIYRLWVEFGNIPTSWQASGLPWSWFTMIRPGFMWSEGTGESPAGSSGETPHMATPEPC